LRRLYTIYWENMLVAIAMELVDEQQGRFDQLDPVAVLVG
jgi:hypothetical protein